MIVTPRQASCIPPLVLQNPTLGLTFILQLTGVKGSRQFDKLTRTKTIESILSAMNAEGISQYIEWLLEQVNETHTKSVPPPCGCSRKSNQHVYSSVDATALTARRLWVVDQLASLIRNSTIPKTDSWVMRVLNWFVLHGLFVVRKPGPKQNIPVVFQKFCALFLGSN